MKKREQKCCEKQFASAGADLLVFIIAVARPASFLLPAIGLPGLLILVPTLALAFGAAGGCRRPLRLVCPVKLRLGSKQYVAVNAATGNVDIKANLQCNDCQCK